MSFGKWLINPKQFTYSKITAIVGILAGLAAITNATSTILKNPFPQFNISMNGLEITSHIIHIIFIAIILFNLKHLGHNSMNKLQRLRNNFKEISISNRLDREDIFHQRQERAFTNIESFSLSITFFWTTLLALYLLFFIKDILTHNDFVSMLCKQDFFLHPFEKYYIHVKYICEILYHVTTTLINNMGSIAIFFAFLLVARFIEEERGFSRIYPIMKWLAIAIIFAVIQLASYFIVYEYLSDSDSSIRIENSIKYCNFVFECISGMISGLTLCLLFARLDSKFFNLKTKLIFALYTYAIIQPLFCLFGLPHKNAIIQALIITVLYVALIMKFFFYFLFVWLYETGRVHNYFLFYPTLSEYVKRHWKDVPG